MPQRVPCGKLSNILMVILVVDTVKRQESILILALVKRTADVGVMCTHLNKDFASTTGHAGIRNHEEVKEQALEALKQRSQGKRNVSINSIAPVECPPYTPGQYYQ